MCFNDDSVKMPFCTNAFLHHQVEMRLRNLQIITRNHIININGNSTAGFNGSTAWPNFWGNTKKVQSKLIRTKKRFSEQSSHQEQSGDLEHSVHDQSESDQLE